MASVEASDSLPDSGSAPPPLDNSAVEKTGDSDKTDAVQSREVIDDPFVGVCISIEYVRDLMWYSDQAQRDNGERRIYVRFSIDPGNVHVSTDTFVYTERCSKTVEMVLPVSLTTERSGTMMVTEVWEVQNGLQHEFVGHSRDFVHKLLHVDDSGAQEMRLNRRRGNICCGRLGMSVTLSRDFSVLSRILSSESSVHRDKMAGQMKANLVVMVLEGQELPQRFNPVVQASVSSDTNSRLHSDAATYDDKRNAFVWNHRFCFEVAPTNVKDGSVSFDVIQEDDGMKQNHQEVVGTASLQFSAMKLDGSLCCVWLALQPTATREGHFNARIRVTCCLLLENTQDGILQGLVSVSEASPDRPTVGVPLSIPLGGFLELKIEFVCATSLSEAKYLREFVVAGNERSHQLSVRGRLHLVDGISQRSVASASISAETKHCDDQTCFRLQTDNGDGITLRFELSPDVLTSPLPQLSLAIRSRSQKKSLSLWIALPFLLKRLRIGMEYQCSLKLLDEQERTCGRLRARFRGGLQTDLENSDRPWTTVEHKPKACLITVKLSHLRASGCEGNDTRCYARIWSSTTGKIQGQTITPLVRKNCGVDTEVGEGNTVSLKVADSATEMIFVGIYRFSTHERNELIGLGRFSICSLQVPIEDDDSQHLPVEQCVHLYSETMGKESECGSVTLSLQTTRVVKENESDSSVSLAATGLGSVAYYPVQNGEMKCRFDVDILEVQGLPSNVSEGDSITIHLCIAQSNWKAELTPAKVVLTADGSKSLAPVDEIAHTVICWSAKDRSFPVLQISVYIQRQRQPDRMGTRSTASLVNVSHMKRRQEHQNSKSRTTNEPASPQLVATGCLNLSSFFSQLNVSVHANLELDVEQEFENNDSQSKNAPGKMSVLSRLRASSCQEENAKSPSSFGISSLVSQSVKGDVCIHLLQASGSALKRTSSLSSYYVSISSGSEEVRSSCSSADDASTLTWNQQLVLPNMCAGPPVIHLTLYHRSSTQLDSSNFSRRLTDDQVIGYLTLPIFPSVLEEKHLLQLELPFGMPFDSAKSNSTKQTGDPYYYKRGMITLEMQFLSNEQPKTGTSVPTEVFELVIHRVRGTLLNSSNPLRSPDLVKHLFIEISIITNQSDTDKELSVGATGVISLSPSGMTEINEVVDLSNPIVAAALLNDPTNVFVGRIRDLSGNYYGRVHLPLRKDWKERLTSRKKQVWYPICIESSNADVTATKDALLMSLQVCQQLQPTQQVNTLGKFHVSVCEAIITSGFERLNLMKLGNYGGANVQLVYTSTKHSNNEIRSRTRQSTDQNSCRWRWENEWFVFTHVKEENGTQELEMSLQIGVHANQPQLDGRLNLSSVIEDAKLRRQNLWIPLRDEPASDDATVNAHLHVVVVYIPSIIGTFKMDFGESYTFSESERILHVESIFYKCTIHETSYNTAIVTTDNLESGMTDENESGSYKRLRLPFDSGLGTTGKVPEFAIQRMGVTKTLGEICFGVFSVDLLLVAELCGLTSVSGETPERFVWCEFADKSDETKITGVAKLRVGFEPARNLAEFQNTGKTKKTENRVASAEMFTIWKKLFYLLDQNGNGYIDRKEFTDVFVTHLEDLLFTSDGQKLLKLLFGDDGDQDSDVAPTQQQITTLFSAMDTNRDNAIEWSEYLRFLQERQQNLVATINENPADDKPEVAAPQLEQKREMRKKNREDRCATLAVQSNQDEIPPEQTREANSRSGVLKQEPAAPKRPSKVSSAEVKLMKLQYSNQEQSRLQKQISSLETILAIERRRYAELAADRQGLMRSYQQLHLKHQNEIIQEQTKTKWMKQTIERQQQQLEERETLRQNRYQASIVLQSTVRSRLEQKRFHGLKFQRANAAIVIQCMVRRVKATKQLIVLQELDRVAKQRVRTVSRMQRFIRFHLYRKERALLVEVRKLSATILQKNARRMVAHSTWQRQKISISKLQCWIRQRLAVRRLTKVREATTTIKTAVMGWFKRWQYKKMKNSSRKVQRWWRRASKERSAFLELVEAAICIQSAWKRRIARRWYEREWQRQEKYLTELEATICLQAAWRGRQQRSLSIRSRFDDDSAIEALLYNIVATIEADAVIPTNSEHSFTTTVAGDLSEPSSMNITLNNGVKTLTKATEDTPLSARPEDALAVNDATIGGGDEILPEVDINSNGGTGDQNFPQDAEQVEQNVVMENLEEAGSRVLDIAATSAEVITNDFTNPLTPQRGIHADGPDDSDLEIIQKLLEDMKERVISSEDTIQTKGTVSPSNDVPSVNEPRDQDFQEETLRDKLNKVQTEAPLHDQITANEEETSAVKNVQEGDVSDIHTVLSAADEEILPVAQLVSGETIPTVVEQSGIVPLPVTNNVTSAVNTPGGEHIDPPSALGGPDTVDISDSEVRDEDSIEAITKSEHEDDTRSEQASSNPDSALPLSAQLDATFDRDIAVGDFAMPHDSDSDETGVQDDDTDDDVAGGSSIDSTDLMMEADAVAIMQNVAIGDNVKVTTAHPVRPRKAERMDSSVLLADFDQLEAQNSTGIPATFESTGKAGNEVNTESSNEVVDHKA